MKNSIQLIAEFIAPFEDDLHMIFVGDNIDQDTINLFTKFISKSRKDLPDNLDPINFHTISSSQLFRGQYSDTLKDKICIQYLDSDMSNNVISYLINELDDEMEGMLIEKHILLNPQEKYIFDITTVSDDNLAHLCQNMDSRNGAYNYMIIENYLAIWILYQDEFSCIQDL